jgi:predicted nucleotide-binding protein (sugar kinase/HSP70/actin superfamily)
MMTTTGPVAVDGAASGPGPVRHYTAYRPRPFTRAERERVTVLYGGLTWKHERLVQGVFHGLGYRAEPLPNVSRADLDAGKALIDVGACCPTTFVTGNLVNFLKTTVRARGARATADDYVYLTAGACGACRFGQYHQSYTMALATLGLPDFRVLLMAQDGLEQGDVHGGGVEINLPLSTGLIWALLCGDLLTDLEYMTRPYEVVPGRTDQVLRQSVEHLYEVFRLRPMRGTRWGVLAWHLLTRHFTDALRAVKREWDTIEVDRLQPKPRVKITGEFWLQTHEGDGNYNIKRWLEQEGAEVVAPPIAVWLDYWMRFFVQELEDRRGTDRYAALKIRGVKTLQWVFRTSYDRLRRALGLLPSPLPDQYELRRLAAPYFHHRLSGGEGDMLIGKALYAHHHKTAHMVCELTPYSCMPNTMSIGAMAQVLGRYPDLLYAPIEVKGDADVHALSRCQMILTEARQRARQEYEAVLARTGLSVDDVRRHEAERPGLRRSTYRVPHQGVAGSAANYLLHIAPRVRRDVA